MDQFTESFIERARAGEPVFLHAVRDAYATLPDQAAFTFPFAVGLLEGGEREFVWRLPRFSSFVHSARHFVGEFFLAQIYNILSGLGGRYVRFPDTSEWEAHFLLGLFRSEFCVDLRRHERHGYGLCLNVAERMLAAIGRPERVFTVIHGGGRRPPAASARIDGEARTVFDHAPNNLAGKALLGMDVGGTDIKLALVVDGRLVRCLEFDWNPAAMAEVEAMVSPIVDLVRLMAGVARAAAGDQEAALRIAPAMAPGLDRQTLGTVADSLGPTGRFRFDAVGICFPDVVVNDRIVGGEGPKTVGLRRRLGDGFEAAFSRLANLGEYLADQVKPDGELGIVNDGPMAAFTAGVETAVLNPERVREGVFAHTLGTDFGTGWIDRHGRIPALPLEVYNFIVDLGSWPERDFPPDDVRSINNQNSGLSGTMQKYASQSGVFRLLVKAALARRPAMLDEMCRDGLLVRTGNGGLQVPSSPRDMRKPLLEAIMAMAGKDSLVDGVFEQVGESLAAVSREVDLIVGPAAGERMLLGRLVKNPACCESIRRGAERAACPAAITVADERMAETSVMRQLRDGGEFSIAQFAQAVGAAYYANYLLESRRERSPGG